MFLCSSIAYSQTEASLSTSLQGKSTDQITKEYSQLRITGVSSECNFSLVKYCVEHGANVNMPNSEGKLALVESLSSMTSFSDKYFVVRFLLDNGADPNLKANTIFSRLWGKIPALNMAVITSSVILSNKQDKRYDSESVYVHSVFKYLLDSGAFVSGKDDAGHTPLHIAAQFNNVVAANILIAAGAKIMPQDNIGKTPLDYAESSEMIKLLKSHGAYEK
jgi:ankyrin repeat protein